MLKQPAILVLYHARATYSRLNIPTAYFHFEYVLPAAPQIPAARGAATLPLPHTLIYDIPFVFVPTFLLPLPVRTTLD